MRAVAGTSIAAFALVFAAAPAQAQLVDCTPPERAPYVMFLDEPQFTENAFKSQKEMLAFFDALHEHLDQRRDREMAGLPPAPFRVARCVGRKPSIEGKDYTPEMVRSLYNRSVVIELWSKLDASVKGGKRVAPTAQVNYLLLPLRRAGDEGRARAPALHRFNYPDGDLGASDFVELLSNADLQAFVAAGIGLMAFDADDFVSAQRFLCIASPRLDLIRARLAKRDETKAQSEDVRLLRGYVLERAGDAVTRLKRNPAGGIAALLSAGQPCGA